MSCSASQYSAWSLHPNPLLLSSLPFSDIHLSFNLSSSYSFSCYEQIRSDVSEERCSSAKHKNCNFYISLLSLPAVSWWSWFNGKILFTAAFAQMQCAAGSTPVLLRTYRLICATPARHIALATSNGCHLGGVTVLMGLD